MIGGLTWWSLDTASHTSQKILSTSTSFKPELNLQRREEERGEGGRKREVREGGREK